MKAVAIYVEGGGDTATQKAEFRNGFDGLLHSQKQAARTKQLGWKVVPSGGRDQAYRAFRNALDHADDDETLVVLLVDSEDSVAANIGNKVDDSVARVLHLTRRDGWDISDVESSQIHLMVQCMEAWIVSDGESLASYYGQGFRANILPVRANLEDEPKAAIYEKLKRATRETRKGEYAKIRHASKLLALIAPSKVASRCVRFKTFSEWLAAQIQAS